MPGSNFLNNTSTALPIAGVRIALTPLIDLSPFKKFQLYESATFEIRGEFFNVMNSANSGGPNEFVGNALFSSTVLTQANDHVSGSLPLASIFKIWSDFPELLKQLWSLGQLR